MLFPDDRRAEAEKAWDEFTTTHRVPYEWVASVSSGFREGYLAGDTAGYAHGRAAERERAERAEADAAALRAGYDLIFAGDEHYGGGCPLCDGVGHHDTDCSVGKLLATDHPGAPLLAALGAAREALAPFAKLANDWDRPTLQPQVGDNETGSIHHVRIGDIRTARAALAQLDAAGAGIRKDET